MWIVETVAKTNKRKAQSNMNKSVPMVYMFSVRTPVSLSSAVGECFRVQQIFKNRERWQRECGGKNEEMGSMWLYQPQMSILAGCRTVEFLSSRTSGAACPQKDSKHAHKHGEFPIVHIQQHLYTHFCFPHMQLAYKIKQTSDKWETRICLVSS